ncbi:MAG: phosphatase PAP2 family protein [Gemmatimonadaceae bacterium]
MTLRQFLHRPLLCLAAAATFVLPAPLAAQATEPAPPAAQIPLFTWRDAYLAGGFVAATLALRPVDKYFATRLQDKYTQSNQFLQKVAVIVRTIAEPGAFVIGGSLYVVGRATKQRDMADLGLHGTEAVVVASVFAGGLKDVFGRARPFVHPPTDSTGYNPNSWEFGRGFTKGDDYRSFPSGHSVAAFAAAAAVANESYRWWPNMKWPMGVAMYGGATLVGVSRMYNNRHWASDVMMGAAIGTFAGNKVVRYHHRVHPDNKFDKWLLGGSLHQNAVGHYTAFSWSIFPPPR